MDALSSMNKNITSAVEFDEKVSKEIYKDAEGIFENLFINGSIDTFNRLFDNRYNNE